MDYAASGLALPHNVMRQPRGPAEKGKGFQKWCRSRMEPAVSKKPSRAVPIVAPPPAQSPSIAKEEVKKEEVKEEMKKEGEVAGAMAMPKIFINPVIVIHEESCTSEEDEGHFSDAGLESEKSRWTTFLGRVQHNTTHNIFEKKKSWSTEHHGQDILQLTSTNERKLPNAQYFLYGNGQVNDQVMCTLLNKQLELLICS